MFLILFSLYFNIDIQANMQSKICHTTFNNGATKICISEECELQNPYICEQCEEEHEHNGTILAVRRNKLVQIQKKVEDGQQKLKQQIENKTEVLQLLQTKVKAQLQNLKQRHQKLNHIQSQLSQVFAGQSKQFRHLWKELKHQTNKIQTKYIRYQIQHIQALFIRHQPISSLPENQQNIEQFQLSLCQLLRILPLQRVQNVRPQFKDQINKLSELAQNRKPQLLTICRLYELVADFEGSHQIHCKLLQQNPFDVQVINGRAKVNTLMKKYEEANDDYTSLIDLTKGKNNSQNYYYYRAQLNQQNGKQEHALQDYKKYIELNAQDVLNAHQAIAQIKCKNKEYEIALQYYQNSLQLSKHTYKQIRTLQKMYDISKLINNQQMMLTYLNQLISISQDRQHLLNRATLLHESGRFSQAYADYTSLIQKFPQNAQLRYNRGLVSMNIADKLQSTIKDLVAAIQYDPNLKEAYVNLGTIYMNLTQQKTYKPELVEKFRTLAIYYLEQSTKFFVKNQKIYYYLGILYHLHHNQKAYQNYTTAITLNPNYIEAYIGRIKVSILLQNNYNQALSDTHKLIRLGANTVQVFLMKSIIEEKLDLLQQCIGTLDKIIGVQADNVEALQCRVRVNLKRKERELAKADLLKLRSLVPQRQQQYGRMIEQLQ